MAAADAALRSLGLALGEAGAAGGLPSTMAALRARAVISGCGGGGGLAATEAEATSPPQPPPPLPTPSAGAAAVAALGAGAKWKTWGAAAGGGGAAATSAPRAPARVAPITLSLRDIVAAMERDADYGRSAALYQLYEELGG